MAYRLANKTVDSAQYHLTWCPKYRKRILVGPVETRLKEIVAEVIAEIGGEVPRLAWRRCLWSPSWFCSMVRGAPRVVVGRDVENQRAVA